MFPYAFLTSKLRFIHFNCALRTAHRALHTRVTPSPPTLSPLFVPSPRKVCDKGIDIIFTSLFEKYNDGFFYCWMNPEFSTDFFLSFLSNLH